MHDVACEQYMILLSSAILLDTPTSYGVALEESTLHEQPYAKQACIYYRGAGRWSFLFITKMSKVPNMFVDA